LLVYRPAEGAGLWIPGAGAFGWAVNNRLTRYRFQYQFQYQGHT
jgi:hypothetical protein